MKINLYDLFDSADVDDLTELSSQCLSVEHNDELSDKIIKKVSAQIKKPKRIGKIIALVAVIAVLISSISVLGENYFSSNANETPFIEVMDGVDLPSVEKEINISYTANGLTFVLNRVYSDNTNMRLYFICPEYKGYIAEPKDIAVYANGEKIESLSVGVGTVRDNIDWVDISLLDGAISDGMDIKITFSGFHFVNDKGWVKERIYFKAWEFEFKSFGDSSKRELSVNPFKYKNETVKPFNFVISPLGYSFNCVINSDEISIVPVQIEMKDGTVYYEENGILSGIIGLENNEYKILGEFNTVIDTEKIKSIKIYDTVIYNT